MEKLISCCGLDCATCNAKIATATNDNDLRRKTAEEWSAQYKSTITAEMINCDGCRTTGVHFGYCDMCEIRNCVKEKAFETCGDCTEMSSCKKVEAVHQYVPEAIANLQSLKN
jgi:hypothetical protein